MQNFEIILIGLLALSIVSGMLGLGVAFSAVPFLSLFLPDLVNQVQPLTLILNGITALFATIGFAKAGNINWKKAIMLAAITTASAPLGSYFVQFSEQNYVLYVYLAVVIFLAYTLFKPTKAKNKEENLKLALIFAVPISVLAGFLGIGPGFLLMPTLILLGFKPKMAAGINAFAVTPPSFSALIPHLPTAVFDFNLLIPLMILGGGGAFLGAKITNRYVPDKRLKQMFGILIVVMTAYKIYTMVM